MLLPVSAFWWFDRVCVCMCVCVCVFVYVFMCFAQALRAAFTVGHLNSESYVWHEEQTGDAWVALSTVRSFLSTRDELCSGAVE